MMNQGARVYSDPQWWSPEHASAWDRVKAALRRDWEQTKADFSKTSGRELNQDIGDTVKQAVGSQPIPPAQQPNPPDVDEKSWDKDEPALRYGYGARSYYGQTYSDWDDRLEGKLREEWTDLKTGRTWDEVKSSVRRGWDSARAKLS